MIICEWFWIISKKASWSLTIKIKNDFAIGESRPDLSLLLAGGLLYFYLHLPDNFNAKFCLVSWALFCRISQYLNNYLILLFSWSKHKIKYNLKVFSKNLLFCYYFSIIKIIIKLFIIVKDQMNILSIGPKVKNLIVYYISATIATMGKNQYIKHTN